MMISRGRRATILAGVVGIGVLASTGFAFRAALIERWQLSKLDSSDREARRAALTWLASNGSARAISPLIRFIISHPDETPTATAILTTRERTQISVLFHERQAPKPVDALRAILDKRKTEAVRILAGQLADPDARVRRFVAGVFAELGEEAIPFVPNLVQSCGDEDDLVRYKSSLALESIGEPAVPAIVIAIKRGTPELRRHLTWLLGKIGVSAGGAASALAEAARDPDERARAEATVALKRIPVEK